eukprot:gene3898-4865_t
MTETERTEESMGIKLFLGKSKPFSGLIKQRFNDFIVNEIDQDGNVVHLTDLTFVDDKKKGNKEFSTTPEDDLKTLVGEEKTLEFMNFYNGPNKSDAKSYFMFAEDTDKDHRTLVHKCMKERFLLCSETSNGAVKVWSQLNPKKKAINDRSWPSDKPKYVQFKLCKENRDTMDTITTLARLLKNSAKSFSFAGTKDKRGITTQRITVFKVTPDRLAELNSRFLTGGTALCLGEFKYVDRHLQLGDLSGNRFSVVIREVTGANDQEISESVEEFKKTGFINYFGMQRFGTGTVPTYEIGIAVLQGNWEKAAHLILDPRPGEKEDAVKARKYYKETGDAKGTIAMIPKSLNAEKMLLIGLKGGKSYEQSFAGIPRTLRMLYTHSYQSLIFNRMASERIRIYGHDKPVVGDLVIISEESKNKLKDNNEAKDSKDNNNKKEGESNIEEGDEDLDENDIEQQTKLIKVGHVTEEDVTHNRYSMNQVVIPLIGNNIILPKNKIGELMLEELAKDNLKLEQFNSKNRVYDLRGGYRKLIGVATDITYKIFNYDDFTINLGVSDLNTLRGDKEPEDLPNGKFKALRVCFNLPSSTYATMAYREILKKSSDIL